MGQDKVRHVRLRKGRLYWIPSKTLEGLGYSCEPLGKPGPAAYARAVIMNDRADEDRRKGIQVSGELSATATARMAALYFKHLEKRLEKGKIGARTVKDYRKLMPVILADYGTLSIEVLDDEVCETWLDGIENQWTRYHVGLLLRTFRKWCAGKLKNDAIEPGFEVSQPRARKVHWKPEEILAVVEQLKAMEGCRSLAVGVLVEWCIGQNPADVWRLPRTAYAAGAIDVTRTKTNIGGKPIRLWSYVRAELDAYLEASPAIHGAPLFRDPEGKEWIESTRLKKFARARKDAKLPKQLQMRDLRRTAITEGLSLGFTKEQVRSVSRHSTSAGLDPYDDMPNTDVSDEIQDARGEKFGFHKRAETEENGKEKVETS